MNILNRIKIFAVSSLAVLSMSSCNDWLNVSMEDKIMEKDLFSNYDGYLMALNGVYLSMNDVYARTLTTGAIDVMAQYYNVTENNSHAMKLYSSYSYSDNSFEAQNYNFWSRMYTLLANLNAVIEHTELDNTPLTAQQHAVIRGEALGLRAFFHFDLLRLYGPIYSVNPTAQCIPYQNSTDREIQPLLPADQVLDLIIKDLHEAEALLRDYDPIITEGAGNTVPEDDGIAHYDMAFRQIRFNYYAVEALLARAYMWKGDKATAYDIAKHKIIDAITTEDLEVFPWATKEQVTAEGKPDYLLSSEVIFSLYNSKRTDIQSAYFTSTLPALTSRLTFYGSDLTGDSKVATFYDDVNDIRRNMWTIVEPTQSEKDQAGESGETANNTVALLKFADFASDAKLDGSETYRYMMPLMRLSEIYLIAAEATSDNNEAFELINTIRYHRECPDYPTEYDLGQALTYEMAREVIGEGQLFFFYKRRNASQLISGTSATPYNMVSTNYTWPIPEEELNKRTLVGDK